MRSEPEYDVALSFAGEDRPYVSQVAAELGRRGLRCFYDADQEVHLWGKDLLEELNRVYTSAAAVVVVFVSRAYVEKDWPRAERRAALARAMHERREYVLPARFDDTELPGMPATVAYAPLKGRTPQQFADLIARKVQLLQGTSDEARDRWVHSYPAAHGGEVWMRISAQPGHEDDEHRFELRWGGWKKRREHVRPGSAGSAYWFTKEGDGRSFPLVVEVDPPARVSFGTGHLPGAQEL